MSNLIDEITQADVDLRAAEADVAEASRRLRHARGELRERREELSRLILELRTGQSRYPMLERFGPDGERLAPSGLPLAEMADDHQRGPTSTPAIAAAKAGRKGRKPARPRSPGASPEARS